MIMTRNLNTMARALMAFFAMSAVVAQGALATEQAHQFHADGARTVITGVDVGTHEFTIGAFGIVKCGNVETESTQVGTEVSASTFAADTITVTPRFSECTFGGNAAGINFEHCAYVFDSDTTDEHATMEIECAEKSSIKIATTGCTITIGSQVIKYAAHYEFKTAFAFAISVTGSEIEIGNLNDKGSCFFYPKGKVGKYVGTTEGGCFRDDGSELSGTEKTTPQWETTEGSPTQCTVSNF